MTPTEENSIDSFLSVRKPKQPARDNHGRLIYEAFDAKDKIKVVEIRTTQGINRAPSYAYLLDVISDGEKGEEITLLFSFMLVEIRGRNLQSLARALIKRDCAIIQEYDPAKFAPHTPEQPLIESIAIKARGV